MNTEITTYGVSQECLTIERIVSSVAEGTANPLDAMIAIKILEDKLAEAKEAVKEAALEEAAKHPEKTLQMNGVKITKMDGRANYDYKHIPEWVSANNQLKAIEERAKIAAQNLNKGINSISEDAEIITPCKISYSKPTISISFK